MGETALDGLCGRPGDSGPRAGNISLAGLCGLPGCRPRPPGLCGRPVLSPPRISGKPSLGANIGKGIFPTISGSLFRERLDGPGAPEKGNEPMTGEFDADLLPLPLISIFGLALSEPDPLRIAGSTVDDVSDIFRPVSIVGLGRP